MLLDEVTCSWAWIDRPDASAEAMREYWKQHHAHLEPTVTRLESDRGATEVVEWVIPGHSGRTNGGDAPTLAIAGRLGGVGARPTYTGTVSDGDGAVVAAAVALKLSRAHDYNEPTAGDVHVITHVCPDAPTRDVPVPGQMDSPVPPGDLLQYEAPAAADAVFSVDTTRGHRIMNHTGIAVTATLVNGYLLRVSEDLLDLYADVTNEPPQVLPVTMQDILPTGSGIYRINSIMAPGEYFDGPVVGVATVSASLVRGTRTGATPPATLETAARFCVEAARRFGEDRLVLHDAEEYGRIVERFGPMDRLVGRG